MKTITVRDLLAMDIDVDVCDDVDESLYIAFVGPVTLTPAGELEFADALDLEVTLPPEDNDYCYPACVHVDHPNEKVWRRQLRAALDLFYALGGYCMDVDYEKWFIG